MTHHNHPQPNLRRTLSARALLLEFWLTVWQPPYELNINEYTRTSNLWQSLSPRDRSFALKMMLIMLRQHSVLKSYLQQIMDHPPKGKARLIFEAIALLGLVQVIWLNTPIHAVLNEGKQLLISKHLGGLTKLYNGLMGKTARDKAAGNLSLPSPLQNIPAQWQQGLSQALVPSSKPDDEFASGQETDRLKERLTQLARIWAEPPPLDLHLNPNHPELSFWRESLQDQGGVNLLAGVMRFEAPYPPIEELSGYREGGWWVQNLAASLPVRMLGSLENLRVWDIAAAPGGKSLQCLAYQAGFLLSLDKDESRLAKLKQSCSRLGFSPQGKAVELHHHMIVADILDWTPPPEFAPPQVVILDAPCGASGTIARHPEILWRPYDHQPRQARLDIQRAMLSRAASWLAAGGRLLYCVCSLDQAEGPAQIEKFMANHPSWQIITELPSSFPAELAHCFSEKNGFFQSWPDDEFTDIGGTSQQGLDGFFACIVQKPA